MANVNQYEIFCVTDQKFVRGWGTAPPTVCYENNTHEVNPNSISLISSVSNNKVFVENEQIPDGYEATGGNYKCHTVRVSVQPNETKIHVISEPIPMCINVIQLNITTQNIGDVISLVTLPNTVIGTLRSNIETGTTVIPINAGTIPYLKKGFNLKISNGTDVDELGQIIIIDSENLTVTVRTATTRAYLAESTIMTERIIIDSFYMCLVGQQEFGRAKLGSSYVPANSTTHIIYKNNSNEAKEFTAYYEHYF